MEQPPSLPPLPILPKKTAYKADKNEQAKAIKETEKTTEQQQHQYQSIEESSLTPLQDSLLITSDNDVILGDAPSCDGEVNIFDKDSSNIALQSEFQETNQTSSESANFATIAEWLESPKFNTYSGKSDIFKQQVRKIFCINVLVLYSFLEE